jgi:ribosomal protein S18 acetylase RimI-like enzyme
MAALRTTYTVTLRPVSEADETFLRTLYASTREQELSAVSWTSHQKSAFLDMQFHAQDHYYRTHYQNATFEIIEVDGSPAGRLYIDVGAADVRIIDIALLPEHRGHGLGGALMRDVLSRARDAGRSVSIHVENDNPARRLYERLGFREVEQRGIRTLMVAS